MTPPISTTIEERFWAKVRKSSDCWEWTGSKANGYGRFYFGGNKKAKNQRLIPATHCSWWLHTGSWVPNDRRLCHSCDNPGCVRPDHLFIGTAKDNSQDMARKNRSAFGSRSGVAKLKPEDIAEIFALRRSGVLQQEIADRFGISVGNVGLLLNGRTWLRHRPEGQAPLKGRIELTHCLHGHEFTPENTRIRSNGKTKRCRKCAKLEMRARRERKVKCNAEGEAR